MKQVVVGILGSRLDHTGLGKKRWNRWRPTLSIFQHDDFKVDQLILIYHFEEKALAQLTIQDIQLISPATKITPYQVDYENPWDFEQVYAALFDIAISHPFNTEKNQYFVHITTGTHVIQICLYLLTEAHFFPGKLLQTMPVKGGKGEGRYQIIDLDLSCYDQIASRFKYQTRQDISYLKSGIDTRNMAFNQLIQELEQVSVCSTEPILLTGATGVGKSRLARRIYELKRQRNQIQGALIQINCATLRGDNAMSSLFGHCKGAFTGALKERTGLLRMADGGLLFLDEIGELGLDEQAMLLRAIEEKTFMPFGSDQETHSDFQLIAGTNRNLFKQVQKGLFRADLLARINLWSYEMPSLKNRIEDLKPNIEYELIQYTRKAGHKISFNKDARALYLQFAYSEKALWKANFRDLHSSITRMATLAEGGRINERLVKHEIQRLLNDWQIAQKPNIEQKTTVLLNALLGEKSQTLDLFDQLQLVQIIQICQTSSTLAEAGRKLFNISRIAKKNCNDSHRLRQYLKKFDLDFAMIKTLLKK